MGCGHLFKPGVQQIHWLEPGPMQSLVYLPHSKK
jgi:hypothetical protein